MRGARNRVSGPQSSRSRSQSASVDKLRTTETETAGYGGQLRFHIPDVWTAWPVPPEELLTHDRGNSPEHDMLSSRHADDPIVDLEDGLLAETLRHAKERWQSRIPEAAPVLRVKAKRNWELERMTTRKLRAREALELTEVDHSVASDHENNLSGASSTSSPSLPPVDGVNYFSSQIVRDDKFLDDEDGSASDSSADRLTEGDPPVFLADDDCARRILIPSVRHILSKLDDLLLALHKQRNAYAVPNRLDCNYSAPVISGPETTDVDESTLVRSGSRRARRTRSRHEYRGRKRKREQSKQPDVEIGSGEERVAATPRSRTRSTSVTTRSHSRYHNPDDTYKTSHLGLRDWSDLLGVAALAGWNTDAVGRAAARCAKLFGENMVFRTFYEASSDSRPYHQKTVALTEEDGESPSNDGASCLPAALQILKQQPEYVRISEPCSLCTVQHLRCEPAEPSDKPNESNSEGCDQHLVPCRTCLTKRGLTEPCSGITAKLKPRATSSEGLACPHPTCPRHVVPFAKRYRLHRHLDTVHDEAPPPSGIARLPIDAHLTTTITDLNCPVTSCPQHKHVYTRPTHLFTHIRRGHPEIDLGGFRDLLRQKMGRRWGKNEHTSASVSEPHGHESERGGRISRRTAQAEVDDNRVQGINTGEVGAGRAVGHRSLLEFELVDEHQQDSTQEEVNFPIQGSSEPGQLHNAQGQEHSYSRTLYDDGDDDEDQHRAMVPLLQHDGDTADLYFAKSTEMAMKPLNSIAGSRTKEARQSHHHGHNNKSAGRGVGDSMENWVDERDPLLEIDFEQFDALAGAGGESDHGDIGQSF